MSGRGAPAFTEAPRPARPNGMLVPATTLPFFIRSSSCSGPPAMISAGALDCSFCSSEGPVSKVTVTLFLVAFSYPAATSKTPVDGPMPVMIQSSAAWLVPLPPARPERPTAKPKATALVHDFMAYSLYPRPKANRNRRDRWDAAYSVLRPRASGLDAAPRSRAKNRSLFRAYGAPPRRPGSAPVLRPGFYIEFHTQSAKPRDHDNAAAL